MSNTRNMFSFSRFIFVILIDQWDAILIPFVRTGLLGWQASGRQILRKRNYKPTLMD